MRIHENTSREEDEKLEQLNALGMLPDWLDELLARLDSNIENLKDTIKYPNKHSSF